MSRRRGLRGRRRVIHDAGLKAGLARPSA